MDDLVELESDVVDRLHLLLTSLEKRTHGRKPYKVLFAVFSYFFCKIISKNYLGKQCKKIAQYIGKQLLFSNLLDLGSLLPTRG